MLENTRTTLFVNCYFEQLQVGLCFTIQYINKMVKEITQRKHRTYKLVNIQLFKKPGQERLLQDIRRL